MKKMLVITPDLSLNGANVVLIELLDLLSKYVYIHVLSSKDGEFGKKLEERHISYEIHPTVNRSYIHPDDYDLIFLNTSSVQFYALMFQNLTIPVYWWFHESYEQLSQSLEYFVHLGLLSENFHFYGVTPRVIRGLKQLFGIEADLLPMVVQDISMEKSPENIVFIPGAYTYIKGQDIMLSVINRLPQNISSKYTFVFAGYKLPQQEDYYARLNSIAEKMPNVVMLDAISREEVYEYYAKSICVVAPSRIDSTPTTIVEALMLKKLCIVSSGAGVSELMTDCLNGFVYPLDQEDELYKRLLMALSDPSGMLTLSQNGRKLYEEFFSAGIVEQLLLEYMHLQT